MKVVLHNKQKTILTTFCIPVIKNTINANNHKFDIWICNHSIEPKLLVTVLNYGESEKFDVHFLRLVCTVLAIACCWLYRLCGCNCRFRVPIIWDP